MSIKLVKWWELIIFVPDADNLVFFLDLMKIAAFNHMINSGSRKLTLVDFYAEWCGPCQTVSPIVQQVARELSHKINLVKVNVDKSRPVAEKFNIKSIPTLLLMDGNKIIWKKTGYVTKKELKAKLSNN